MKNFGFNYKFNPISSRNLKSTLVSVALKFFSLVSFFCTISKTALPRLRRQHQRFVASVGYIVSFQLHCKYIQWKRDTCKKCTIYKYLQYTVQCRSYSKKLKISFTFIPLYLQQITVETGTHVKSVKITLNIFSVCLGRLG